MKDYRLSEIKTKCTGNCFKCDERNEELSKFCRRFIKTHDDCEMPRDWDIESRDMIELPYKEFHEVYAGHGLWFVFYRTEGGLIDSRYFNEEPEADAFLIELRGSKK